MKSKTITFILIVLISTLILNSNAIVAQTTAAVNIPLNFSDNASGSFNNIVFFGLDPAATSGFDPLLGEDALPPFSPALEVRQTIGLFQSYKDYRNAASFPFSGTEIHNLVWQLNPGATSLTIDYALPNNMTIQIQDNITGTLFNSGVVVGNGSFTITLASILTNAKLTAIYSNFAPALAGPSDLQAVADTFAVLLNWIDNSSNELGFIVERKNGDSLSADPYIVVDSVGADMQSFNDIGRTPNTTYTYRVRAFNTISLSQYTNQVTATTIVPVELISFVAYKEKTSIFVKWTTATELNNNGFELERKMDKDWQKISFITGKGTSTEVTEYKFRDDHFNSSYKGVILYRLKQIDFDGQFTYSNILELNVDFSPKEYNLDNNFPNPFNPATIIRYSLPAAAFVTLKVYNTIGQEIATLVNQKQESGRYELNFNAEGLTSGIYLYKIQTEKFVQTKKMILMK
jgi:hypothetical protein